MSLGFDPEIFLEIAKKLRQVKGLDFQGMLRTAIGRNYYAAFLKSLLKLQSLGEAFTDESRIHADVRDTLNKKRKSNITSKLESLFRMRIDADYKVYARLDNSVYQSSIHLSENIINLIDMM